GDERGYRDIREAGTRGDFPAGAGGCERDLAGRGDGAFALGNLAGIEAEPAGNRAAVVCDEGGTQLANRAEDRGGHEHAEPAPCGKDAKAGGDGGRVAADAAAGLDGLDAEVRMLPVDHGKADGGRGILIGHDVEGGAGFPGLAREPADGDGADAAV